MRVFLLVTGGGGYSRHFCLPSTRNFVTLSAKCFVAIRTDVLISRNVPQHFP